MARTDAIEWLLALAEGRLGREPLWVNPDCGLKTRGWKEVVLAQAASTLRGERTRTVRAATWSRASLIWGVVVEGPQGTGCARGDEASRSAG